MMTPRPRSEVMSRCAQSGVTLLENMVALLVISVGLLGFAGMQAFTLHGGASSTFRQMAMQQAQDMADRIRANPAAFHNAANATNNYDGVTPTANPAAPATDCRAKRCTAVELAAFDIYQWRVANNSLLPGDHSVAGGYIASTPLLDAAGAPILLAPGLPGRLRFTIAMRWDGDNTGSASVGAVPTDCSKADPAKDLRCYSLTVDL
jgi:type IV pilus modification protein PilV